MMVQQLSSSHANWSRKVRQANDQQERAQNALFWFLVILVPVVILLTAAGVMVPLARGLYEVLAGQTVDQEPVLTDTLLAYFFSISSGQDLPDVSLGLAEREHMRDVKGVVQSSASVLVLAGFVVVGLSLILGSCCRKAWLYGSVLTIVLLVLGVFIPFDPAFVLFHQLFFPQGNWQFPSSSFMIQVYNQQFWEGLAVAWVGIAIVISILVFVIVIHKPRKESKTVPSSRTL